MGGDDLFQRGDPPGWGLAVGDGNPMAAGREADSGGATDTADGTGDQGRAVEGVEVLLLRVVVMPRR
jgi:hypothetical protein